ncbi:MAG: HNH endonuclease [Butyricicoccus porcorum]
MVALFIFPEMTMKALNDLQYTASHDFLVSKVWLRKREAILRRDKYLCQRCLQYGRRREAEMVHHIQARSVAPELALTDSNLVSLCNPCHNAIEKQTKYRTKRRKSPAPYG